MKEEWGREAGKTEKEGALGWEEVKNGGGRKRGLGAEQRVKKKKGDHYQKWLSF